MSDGRCGAVRACGRNYGHRGHHGGFVKSPVIDVERLRVTLNNLRIPEPWLMHDRLALAEAIVREYAEARP